MTAKTPLLIGAIAAGLALTADAEARGVGHGPGAALPEFESLDLDADGRLTPDEMRQAIEARARARFDAADRNGDGALSAPEMTAAAEARMAARMAERIAARVDRLDADGDGLLQIEEMRAGGGRAPGAGRLFQRLDGDRDGGLDAQEFAALQERLGARMGGALRRLPARPLGQRPGMHGPFDRIPLIP
jgi:Ca2+-binding EF-hand superfamily protein